MTDQSANGVDQVDRRLGAWNLGRWADKAEENVEEWGHQEVETLLLAIQEELGELTQAHLEARNEDGDAERIAEELDDLAALCVQLRWRLDRQ